MSDLNDFETGVNIPDLDNPLGLDALQDADAFLAFESITAIYHGLLVTPYQSYQTEYVQSSLRKRVGEVASATNISAESILLSIDELAGGTYSHEGAFIDAVKAIIEKLIEWGGIVRDYLLKVLRHIFDTRTAQRASNKKASSDFKSAKANYEKANKPFPTNIVLDVPGQCYLAFHTQRHVPKAGYVYNHDGLAKAIDNVNRDLNRFLEKLEYDLDSTLGAVELLVNQISAPNSRDTNEALKRIHDSRGLLGLFNNGFECAGFRVISKPVRNQTPHFQQKFGLHNVIGEYGWSAVSTFNVTVDSNSFEKLNQELGLSTYQLLDRIADMSKKVSESKALKRLAELRKNQQIIASYQSTQLGDKSSNTLNQQKQTLDRLNLVYELSNQVCDNTTLASQFVARYVTLLTRMMGSAAESINRASQKN